MTTKLNKPIFCESQTSVRDKSKRRLLIVGFAPGDVISIRLKGCRKAFAISIEQAYFYAAKLEGERIRREKKLSKKLTVSTASKK